MDYQGALYSAIYTTLGIDATLLVSSSVGEVDLVVLDKTAGIDTGEGGPQTPTISPGACVLVSDLTAAGIEVDDLRGAVLTLMPPYGADSEWVVKSYKRRPSPNGEKDGEVLLILEES